MRLVFLLLTAVTLLQSQSSEFLELPYLQLGNHPLLSRSESLVLLWHTADQAAKWSVDVRTSKDKSWRAMEAPTFLTASAPATRVTLGRPPKEVEVPAVAPHRVYRAQLTGLVPGEEFQYRVAKAGAPVFTATGKARKSAAQPYRLVLFGDCAQDTPEQRQIAHQAELAKPDFLFITGDIVYTAGRISEYRTKYFPVYAPLIQSIPFLAAVGNHDTALRNYTQFPDALAYFFYWDQPLNGPDENGLVLQGHEESQPGFLASAAPRFPRMANFSFDYGNAHWTVIDSNPYADWQSPTLLKWLKDDLASAKNARWRFVAFHHPGFNSSVEHFNDQWMRLLAPTFEEAKVDVVFSGHVHNYQRSFPLTFAPASASKGPKGEVSGEWTLDKHFSDGAKAKPKGVIYIVSGGGGAKLYSPEQQGHPETWQPFTDKYIAQVNSMSVIDVDGGTFALKQISATGEEVDRFQIRK